MATLESTLDPRYVVENVDEVVTPCVLVYPEMIAQHIAHALETFGFDRVMYGGDWHVLELAGTYPQWVEIVDWVVEGCTAEEKRKLFRDNAIGFYRLNG